VKRVFLIIVGIAGGVFLLFGGFSFFFAQRADYGWNPALERPLFKTEHPRILFDEGHNNASTISFTGRYWPLARLLRADGYTVMRGKSAFMPGTLDGVQILVIANASGAPKPQMFGINLPVSTDRQRSDSAFTASEIQVLRSWVEQGGSLLLIADHAPFGEAVCALAEALGVIMHKGFVEVPGELSDPLLFSIENGRLGVHPIITGEGTTTTVSRVMTYTGQSLDGPSSATVLLQLPDTAVEAVPDGNDALTAQPAGRAQGLAFEFGRGRVVVLGEGGMVTAQVSRLVPFGMNTGDNDNKQFVLNTMHWLSRKS
jgi:hypothetical protein